VIPFLVRDGLAGNGEYSPMKGLVLGALVLKAVFAVLC